MEFTRIILKPYNTEKSYAAQANGKYAFLVLPNATKLDIAIAFQTIYGHKPVKVTTQIRKPVSIRTGTAHPGYSKLIKIAYVTVPAGVTLSAQQDNTKETAVEPVDTNLVGETIPQANEVTKKRVVKKTVKGDKE
jgi:large subunit ribosomal protein L23